MVGLINVSHINQYQSLIQSNDISIKINWYYSFTKSY